MPPESAATGSFPRSARRNCSSRRSASRLATVADIPIVIPTIYFWDAHYGVSVRVLDGLALSCALNTTYQLNALDKVMFPHLNKLRSAYVVPGVQLHVGAYRVDVVGRFGIKAGAEPLGVLTFQGTDSLTVRVSRLFD